MHVVLQFTKSEQEELETGLVRGWGLVRGTNCNNSWAERGVRALRDALIKSEKAKSRFLDFARNDTFGGCSKQTFFGSLSGDAGSRNVFVWRGKRTGTLGAGPGVKAYTSAAKHSLLIQQLSVHRFFPVDTNSFVAHVFELF